MKTNKEIALETIARINRNLNDDENALVCTKSGEVNPAAAYIELIRDILALSNS